MAASSDGPAVYPSTRRVPANTVAPTLAGEPAAVGLSDYGRSGGYLGFGGVMPPFSREVLSDEAVADIITFLDPQLD